LFNGARRPGVRSQLCGKNTISRNDVQQLYRDVETFLEIQRYRIRRPGEHLETSASRVKTFPGPQWGFAGTTNREGIGVFLKFGAWRSNADGRTKNAGWLPAF